MLLLSSVTGCSVMMAAKGDKKIDTSYLKVGSPKALVRLNVGKPLIALEKSDAYIVCQGDDSSLGRAIGHGIMDVLTLGLWELIGTPAEMLGNDSECMAISVFYASDDKVERVDVLPTEHRYSQEELAEYHATTTENTNTDLEE